MPLCIRPLLRHYLISVHNNLELPILDILKELSVQCPESFKELDAYFAIRPDLDSRAVQELKLALLENIGGASSDFLLTECKFYLLSRKTSLILRTIQVV